MTDPARPVFHLEREDIDGRGELIAIVGETAVTTPLTGAWTSLMHILLQAQDQDPLVPANLRGRRTYAQISKEYARRAHHSVPPQSRAMAKYMRRIQHRFDATWREALPAHEPPPLFDRRGARGARLAIEILPEHRRCRDFGAREGE